MTAPGGESHGDHESAPEPEELREVKIQRLTTEMVRLYLLANEQTAIRNSAVEGNLALNARTTNLVQQDLRQLRAELIKVEAELRTLAGDPRYILNHELADLNRLSRPKPDSDPLATEPSLDPALQAAAHDEIVAPVTEAEMAGLDAAARLHAADLAALQREDDVLLRQLEQERSQGASDPKTN